MFFDMPNASSTVVVGALLVVGTVTIVWTTGKLIYRTIAGVLRLFGRGRSRLERSVDSRRRFL